MKASDYLNQNGNPCTAQARAAMVEALGMPPELKRYFDSTVARWEGGYKPADKAEPYPTLFGIVPHTFRELADEFYPGNDALTTSKGSNAFLRRLGQAMDSARPSTRAPSPRASANTAQEILYLRDVVTPLEFYHNRTVKYQYDQLPPSVQGALTDAAFTSSPASARYMIERTLAQLDNIAEGEPLDTNLPEPRMFMILERSAKGQKPPHITPYDRYSKADDADLMARINTAIGTHGDDLFMAHFIESRMEHMTDYLLGNPNYAADFYRGWTGRVYGSWEGYVKAKYEGELAPDKIAELASPAGMADILGYSLADKYRKDLPERAVPTGHLDTMTGGATQKLAIKVTQIPEEKQQEFRTNLITEAVQIIAHHEGKAEQSGSTYQRHHRDTITMCESSKHCSVRRIGGKKSAAEVAAEKLKSVEEQLRNMPLSDVPIPLPKPSQEEIDIIIGKMRAAENKEEKAMSDVERELSKLPLSRVPIPMRRPPQPNDPAPEDINNPSQPPAGLFGETIDNWIWGEEATEEPEGEALPAEDVEPEGVKQGEQEPPQSAAPSPEQESAPEPEPEPVAPEPAAPSNLAFCRGPVTRKR